MDSIDATLGASMILADSHTVGKPPGRLLFMCVVLDLRSSVSILLTSCFCMSCSTFAVGKPRHRPLLLLVMLDFCRR